MKKYKLVKCYPGSPKLGTEVNYSDLHKIYNYNGGNYYSELPKHQVENLPEFWEEIIEVPTTEEEYNSQFKTYEILSFKSSGRIDTKRENGKFNIEVPKRDYHKIGQYNESDYDGWDIYTIKRLSDNMIFTIGDCTNKGEIYSFSIKDNSINIFFYGGEYLTLSLVEKKKRLFTTEDNIPIYEGDTFYHIYDIHTTPIYNTLVADKAMGRCPNHLYFSTEKLQLRWLEKNRKELFVTEDGVKIYTGDKYWALILPEYNEIWCEYIANITHAYWENSCCKTFSTKEARTEYTKQNKSIFSWKDVEEVMTNYGFTYNYEYSIKPNLEKLLKNKKK